MAGDRCGWELLLFTSRGVFSCLKAPGESLLHRAESAVTHQAPALPNSLSLERIGRTVWLSSKSIVANKQYSRL